MFGGLAFSYYGDFVDLLPAPVNDTSSEGGSGDSDTSTPSSIVIPSPDDGGDGLGAINGLIVTKSLKGEIFGAKFLRINSDNRRVITCDLSLSASLYNKVGVSVPLSDYLRLYPIGQATQTIRALTGHAADFYLVVTPETVATMIENLEDVRLPLRQMIRFPNPIYNDYTFEDGDLLPQDYYIEIQAGTDILSGDTFSVITGSYAEAYEKQYGPSATGGTVGTVQGQAPDDILQEVYTYLLKQLSGGSKELLKTDPTRLSRALSGGETNLTPTFLSNHAELLYKYGESNYRMVPVPYSWNSTLSDIKKADQ